MASATQPLSHSATPGCQPLRAGSSWPPGGWQLAGRPAGCTSRQRAELAGRPAGSCGWPELPAGRVQLQRSCGRVEFWACRVVVVWSCAVLGVWSCGRVELWACVVGRVAVCSCRVLGLGMRSCGVVELWSCGVGRVELCRSGVLGLWVCGVLGLWACGVVELWSCGRLELTTCGHMRTMPRQLWGGAWGCAAEEL